MLGQVRELVEGLDLVLSANGIISGVWEMPRIRTIQTTVRLRTVQADPSHSSSIDSREAQLASPVSATYRRRIIGCGRRSGAHVVRVLSAGVPPAIALVDFRQHRGVPLVPLGYQPLVNVLAGDP